MSRIRYAVRVDGRLVTHAFTGEQVRIRTKAYAKSYASQVGGRVVKITQYSAEETKARRAVIAAALQWCTGVPFRFRDYAREEDDLNEAVSGLVRVAVGKGT